MKDLRFWTLFVLFASTLLLLRSRSNGDVIPPSDPLAQFPYAIGGRRPRAGQRPLPR